MGATNAVKMLSADDNVIRIGGYGVVFGGRDLDGETFTKDTDYWLDLVPSKPVLFDHAQRDIKSALGHVAAVKQDDTGLWVEAELKRHQAYIDQVMALVNAGALGWSSGTVAHLARREGGVIKAWPVVEWSLTPTPAEPRTVGVDFIKSLLADLGEPVPHEINQEQGGDMSEKEVKQDAPVEPAVKVEQLTVDLGPVTDAIKSMSGELTVLKSQLDELKSQPVNELPKATKAAPAHNKYPLGDTEEGAYKAFLRGGMGAANAWKASNATDMNITTDADGGYAVPTGHYNDIIARRDEAALFPKLGVASIDGDGTTVNVTVDAEADGEFVSTSEAGDYDLDAPALGTVAMTLVKYTKEVRFSEELLQDETSNLLPFIANFIGRGLAKTENSLLVTEALANGTAALTLDGAAAITAAEIPELVYLLPDGYQDSAKWLMKRATEGYIRGLTGNDFLFNPMPGGSDHGMPEIWGMPVYNSASMPAISGGNKSLLFGNWNYLARRQSTTMTVLRDPYSLASKGQVRFFYGIRVVYKVLQSEAIIYATHPTA